MVNRDETTNQVLKMANKIADRTFEEFEFENNLIFYRDNKEDSVQSLCELVKDLLTENINAGDIKILVPGKPEKVNEVIRNVFNPENPNIPSREFKDIIWRSGDRVMVKKNNYEFEFFNGDEGNVIEINDDGIRVIFDKIINGEQLVHLFPWELPDIDKDKGIKEDQLEENLYDDGEEIFFQKKKMLRQLMTVSESWFIVMRLHVIRPRGQNGNM